jgi:hypothetical protein
VCYGGTYPVYPLAYVTTYLMGNLCSPWATALSCNMVSWLLCWVNAYVTIYLMGNLCSPWATALSCNMVSWLLCWVNAYVTIYLMGNLCSPWATALSCNMVSWLLCWLSCDRQIEYYSIVILEFSDFCHLPCLVV